MKTWLVEHWFDIVFLFAILTICIVLAGSPVQAKTLAKEPSPEICVYAATADSIKIYYCENIHLFVNQLGFMAFEP